MKRWVSVLLAAMLLCVNVTACAAAAEQSTVEPNALNPEGYPYFMVLEIAEAPQSEGLLPVTVTGCFGDYLYGEDDLDLESRGFDREHPCTVQLAADCEILMPVDFCDNIMDIFVCDDLLGWYLSQDDFVDDDEPLSFHATLQFNGEEIVTKMEYVYFPWG